VVDPKVADQVGGGALGLTHGLQKRTRQMCRAARFSWHNIQKRETHTKCPRILQRAIIYSKR
jgi:hypothetical protein